MMNKVRMGRLFGSTIDSFLLEGRDPPSTPGGTLFVRVPEDSLPLIHYSIETEAPDYFRGMLGEPLPHIRIVHQTIHCSNEGFKIFSREKNAIHPISNNLPGA